MNRKAKYKWECLRRNPGYIKAWEKLPKVLKQGYQDPVKIHLTTDIARRGKIDHLQHSEVINKFRHKWVIGAPICPDLDYEKLILKRHTKEQNLSGLELLFFPDRAVIGVKKGKSGERDFDFDRDFFKTKQCLVLVDMNHPKADVLREFKQLITWLEKHSKNSTSPKNKIHHENLNLYWLVYDLKKAGRSWNECLEELIKHEPTATLQTARNHYYSAERLISKGFDRPVK